MKLRIKRGLINHFSLNFTLTHNIHIAHWSAAQVQVDPTGPHVVKYYLSCFITLKYKDFVSLFVR